MNETCYNLDVILAVTIVQLKTPQQGYTWVTVEIYYYKFSLLNKLYFFNFLNLPLLSISNLGSNCNSL